MGGGADLSLHAWGIVAKFIAHMTFMNIMPWQLQLQETFVFTTNTSIAVHELAASRCETSFIASFLM